MSRIHTQICLVSAQPDPNFFTCIDANFRPENLYLLVTPKMKQEAKNLEKALRGIKNIQQIPVDNADDIQFVMETIKGLIEESWEKNNGNLEGILVNITCGTKLMSIAAISAAQSCGVRSIYVSIAQNQKVKAFILPPKNDSGTKDILPKIEEISLSLPEKYIEKYLMAHGCELTQKNSKWNDLTDKEIAFVDLALTNSQGVIKNEQSLGKLNWILTSQDPNNRKNRRGLGWAEGPQKFLFNKDMFLNKENWPEFEGFLRELDNIGWIKLNDQEYPREFIIQTEEDFNFIHGRWLEKYIAEFIRKMDPEVQPYNLEVRINNGENQNEIDVAFVKGQQLFAIEVKSANLIGEGGGEKQNILHKLEAVSQQIGGINSKKCLVSYRTILNNGKRSNRYRSDYQKKLESLGNNFLELAHQKNIMVIQGLEVCNKQTLRKKLTEWIEHDDV